MKIEKKIFEIIIVQDWIYAFFFNIHQRAENKTLQENFKNFVLQRSKENPH